VITRDNAPVVLFVAGDTGSGLDQMLCQWPNEQPQSCQFATSNPKFGEGRHFVKINATDKAGNASVPVTQDLIIDRTPPVITILAQPPAMSANTMPSYSFNVVDALSGVKSVDCAFDDKANYAPCVSPKSMNFADGSHKFYIRSSDIAGNATEMESLFVIDATAPTVTITKSPSDYSKSSSGTFEFEGKDGLEVLTKFECRLDNAAYASCSSPKTYTGLSEGIHKFEVIGIDNVGNKSAPATRSWYVDTIAPTIAFQLTPASVSNVINPSIKYMIADSGSGVQSQECSLDGGAYAACASDGMNLSGLAAGSHSFRVRATDKAGNVGTSSFVNFDIDLAPPTVQLTSVPASYSNLAQFNFQFTARDDRSVARAECKIDSAAFVNCDSLTAHLVSALVEGGHRFAVRAIDGAGNMSAEAAYTWTVDLTGPVVAYYQLPPASALSTSVVSLGFTATDALSGIQSLECKLDGAVVTCKSGEMVTLNSLAQGVHSFVVIAKDNAGNTTTDTKSITISAPVLKTQVVDVKGNSKVDVLMIVDNSGSMAGEQANMAARFSNFLDNIKSLDWQLGFITTDMSANAVKKDGRLVELTGMSGQFILNSQMLQSTAQTVFGNTVQMGSNGSGTELGFKAAIRAIARSSDTSAESASNRALFRADAGLAMVVVSDAYDNSGTRPEDVMSAVTSKWGGNKPFVFHSIVVPQSQYTDPSRTSVIAGDPCGSYRESVQYDGREYHRLSDMTGGVKGTVCSDNYSAQLANMGKVTAELVNSVTLNCQPIDYNKDGKIDGGDVQVFTAAGAAVLDFTVTGTKVTFTNGLPIGSNQVKYYCAQ
jgi:hypothetical protein